MTLIVFDLVGTLADASTRYAYAFSQTCSRYGLTAPDQGQVLSLLGNKNLKQIMTDLAPDLPDQEINGFMASCNRQCDALLYLEGWEERLYEGARNALETLSGQGKTLGIYTGIREDALAALLEYHDLTPLFEKEYIRGKDNERDGFINNDELKARQLRSIGDVHSAITGINEKIIVVGDSEADFKAAQQNGFSFIGFAPDQKKADRLTKAGAELIITSFDQLTGVVLTLEAELLHDMHVPAPVPFRS